MTATTTNPTFACQCYGPGLAPEGRRTTAEAQIEQLVLTIDGRLIRLPWKSCSITGGGFDHQQLQLSWKGDGGNWAIVPSDAKAFTSLVENAPAALKNQLDRWQQGVKRVNRGFRLGALALGFIVALPFLLLALFLARSDAIAQWITDQIPLEMEQKFGDIAFKQTTQQMALLNAPDVQRVIEEIGAKLTAGSAYTYHWFVADDPTVNAFAVPGGYVVVNSGLIESAESAEELAGVLAHEVQHVEQRHSLKQLVKQAGLALTIKLALGDWGESVLAELSRNLASLSFSRDHETKADAKAVDALREAGIDPSGLLRFFENLAQGNGESIALLSTHPAPMDRMEALRAATESATGDYQTLDYDWQAIKAEVKN